MSTAWALSQLGAGVGDLTRAQREALERDGYFIVLDYFSADEVREMRAAYDDAASQAIVLDDLSIEPGGVFLADLFNKSRAFDRCLGCKPMLAAAHALMGEIRVSSLNGRDPCKGRGQQALHSDAPRLHSTDWRRVNTLIMLDDMSESNGATRVIPGSHKWPALNVSEYNQGDASPAPLTKDELALIPADPLAPHPDEVKISGTAGSVCVVNAHIWHGGTENRSGARRRVLHMSFGRRDVPPQEDQRKCLTRELKARTDTAQQYLLDVLGIEPTAS